MSIFVVDGQTDVLRGFDDVKVYCDCGQKQITNMLHLFFESRKDIPVRFAQATGPRGTAILRGSFILDTRRANGGYYTLSCLDETPAVGSPLDLESIL